MSLETTVLDHAWQRAGAVSEGGPTHPDDTMSTSTEMEEQFSPTFDLQ